MFFNKEHELLLHIEELGGYYMVNKTMELILEGLDCANCAAKIERGVNEIDGVSSAKLNFITKVLTIESNSPEKNENIVKKTEAIVYKYEPDVKVLEGNINKADAKGHLINDDMKESIFKIAASAVIFTSAQILKLPFWGELTLFLASYLLVGSEVLIRAIKNIFKGQVFDENFLMSIATIGAFAVGEG
jgi:Cd2+/Zn2+-exporting ATPase